MSEQVAVQEFTSTTVDGVLDLTLNRPEALNALTSTMLKGLTEAIVKAGRDKAVRVIVISGAGRSFCAGADLGEVKKRMRDGKFEHGEELRRNFNPLILAIRHIEKPVICAIQGTAAGAGASLALACDLKVCSSDAKFINAFSKVGLIPDSGMSWTLPRTIGLSRALEHAWLAKPISADQALEWGLVNRVVPPEDLAGDAHMLADSLTFVPPLSLALT